MESDGRYRSLWIAFAFATALGFAMASDPMVRADLADGLLGLLGALR